MKAQKLISNRVLWYTDVCVRGSFRKETGGNPRVQAGNRNTLSHTTTTDHGNRTQSQPWEEKVLPLRYPDTIPLMQEHRHGNRLIYQQDIMHTHGKTDSKFPTNKWHQRSWLAHCVPRFKPNWPFVGWAWEKCAQSSASESATLGRALL